jgi:hypothetical protein
VRGRSQISFATLDTTLFSCARLRECRATFGVSTNTLLASNTHFRSADIAAKRSCLVLSIECMIRRSGAAVAIALSQFQACGDRQLSTLVHSLYFFSAM